MTRRASLLALLALAACGGESTVGDTSAPRPNVVLVLADDQRYDTLSCTGSPQVETPNIDRLAAEGVLFRRAYVVTSLCCPARATLLTGLYAHETGILGNSDHGPFLDQRRGFPERLQGAGYETAFVGKWHIENPGAAPQRGFDHWVSFEGQGQYEGETYNFDGERRRLEGFNTDVLTDAAIAFVERERARPFCLILSVKNLHGPYFPPERDRRKLLDVPFPAPASLDDPDDTLPAYVLHVRTTPRNKFFEHDEGASREDYVRGYHQLVVSLDDNVGRLLDALEAKDVLDDTLVLYTSDGGFLWGEHGMYRKRAAYEPSIRVPLLARWPAGLGRGVTVDRLALNVDLAPTILALAGAAAPAGLPGRNLLHVTGPEPAADWRRDFLYLDSWPSERDGPFELAVVGERTKYVRYRWGEIEEALFDTGLDPDERTNLASDPAHAADLAEYRERLSALLREARAPATWTDALPRGGEDD